MLYVSSSCKLCMISKFSPAKINLFLHIIKRYDNGYHALQSLVAFTNIGDTLTFETAADFKLGITGPFANTLNQCPYESLSPVQAAQLLSAHTHHPLTGYITLDKQLPIASGIGGGSANAAATLIGLNQLWDTKLSLPQLADIGLALGADVPMCLYNTPALVSGIGEEITPFEHLPTLAIVMVNPGVEVATPIIYQAFRQQSKEFSQPLTTFAKTSVIEWLSEQHNDLEPIACGQFPIIHDVLNALSQTNQCLLWRMSGSGATCFGLYASAEDGKQAALLIQQLYPKWWVKSGLLLG